VFSPFGGLALVLTAFALGAREHPRRDG